MKSIYLAEASLGDLLAELARRYEELNPLPEWAAPVVFAVATYYAIQPDHLRSRRKDEALVRCRHLSIALMAQLHPMRSRAEVCAVVGVEHGMYPHALSRIDTRVRDFPDFRREVQEILKIIRETSGEDGHCRTAPRGRWGAAHAVAS